MPVPTSPQPLRLDLQRDRGLTIHWADGPTSFFPIALLRRLSPSADAKALRQEIAANPLAVLPASKSSTPLAALSAELVGNYALRIRFSDGHQSGIFSWPYLRSLDPHLTATAPQAASEEPAP